jgi:hypothetical protein
MFKKLSRPLRWVSAAMIAVISALLLFAIYAIHTGLPSEEYHVRKSSPLYSLLTNPQIETGYQPKIRAAVISHLPIGSSEQSVRSFIDSNFDGCTVPKYSFNRDLPEQDYHLRYLCVRPLEFGSLAGSGSLEIVFFLNRDGTLADVIAVSDGTYL